MTGIAAGSFVTMIDGNDKSIEEVAVGDDVLAYDFDNKRVMFGKVVEIKKSEADAVEIATANAKIVSSKDHMFFTSENAECQAAGELAAGGHVLWFDLFHGVKEKILKKSDAGAHTFFDFSVADYGNFIANGIIVSGK